MSPQSIAKKRKSADVSAENAKRAKIVKSAERPAPMRSALKQSGTGASNSTKPAVGKKAISKSTKAKRKSSSPVEAAANVTEESKDGGEVDLMPDQTADLLAGFSSSDEDHSEDDAGIAISSIPQAPTTGLIRSRIDQAPSEQDDPETTPGVIYIGHIPHGFFEPQMKAYFSQFGTILNLRLGRNRKTGKSQHHAFVEFASAAVADVVVKTMDKYLLFGHILQVRRVPKEQVKENMFQGAGGRKKPAPRNRLEGGKLKRGATRDVWEMRVEQENKRRAEKAEKLRELGYDFNLPVLRAVADVPVKPKEEVAALDVNEEQKLLEPSDSASENVIEKRKKLERDVVEEKSIPKKRTASGQTQANMGKK